MNDNPFLALFQDIKKAAEAKRHVFATVSSVSSSGVSIRIDGETSGSAKNYTCNTDVKFSVGDRVMASKESGTYVIVCKIGKPGGPEAKTAAMTQPVGVDANGKLWTTPASEQKISKIYAENSNNNTITLNASKIFSPSSTGFSLGTTSAPFEKLYVGSSSTYYWEFTATGIIPSRKADLYFDIGSSTYPIHELYAQAIYIGGTKLTAGGDMTGTNVTMGGSELYHIVCNTSLELRPNSTMAAHPAYLGTSSYYWHYAYIGSNTVSIGSSSTSKLGFFGTSPIARQTLSTSSNNMNYSSATSSNYLTVLNNLVGILKNKYGLIA